ncbi:uncharacterized protein LOC116342449 [Contarinia nasturtii]|uniref:uncharacterized protein LOC116342449 n=1 Tax=Contarinia nasturtii TaxID=265458 RepID=UPI0012D4BB7C|nr:uncharacterized protein LOC116342449 [Contarinia nasturtii]
MLRLYRSIIVPSRNLYMLSTRKCANFGANSDSDEGDDNTEPDMNFIKLIGTTRNDSRLQPNGNMNCLVHQKSENEKSFFHFISMPKHIQEKTGINHIASGQRININGYVLSHPFKSIDDKNKYKVVIMPTEIRLYKNGEEPLPDICIVMLTGVVRSPIWFKNDFASFYSEEISDVRNVKGELTGEKMKFSYSNFVYDVNLRNYIRENINLYDRVFVQGHLGYKSCETNDGKSRSCGSIIVTKIEKI